jgi:ubiquinone/menaquinone biosynthesis C-methylase UbiE
MDDRIFDEKTALEWAGSVEKSQTRERDIYPRLKAWIQRSAPLEILEIGCGQGICSEKIGADGGHYTGVEPSPFLLERAQRLYGSQDRQFLAGNAYDLPLSDASFDAVFSVMVWHLLSDLPKAAAEMGRVLKKSGAFFILTANPDAYPAWRAIYTDATLEGRRFEGTFALGGVPTSRDVLYFHRREEIRQALQDAGLNWEGAETFRPSEKAPVQDYYIAIEGRKS